MGSRFLECFYSYDVVLMLSAYVPYKNEIDDDGTASSEAIFLAITCVFIYLAFTARVNLV